MSRFVGLSLICLMFASAQAAPDVSGSSWSIHMSQNNGEPIQVKSERKEYDKTGVILHRRTQGVIENGVYKTVSEQDLTDSSQRGSRDIDALLKLADKYENKKQDYERNKRKMRRRPGGFFGFKSGEGWPLIKFHPRRYGKGFKKLKGSFKEAEGGNFEENYGENSAQNYRDNVGENYSENYSENYGENNSATDRRLRGNFGFEGSDQKMRHPPRVRHHARGRYPMEFYQGEQRSPEEFARIKRQRQNPDEYADSVSDNMKKRLGNRSRVSFYRPVERLFEKLFGSKKQNAEKSGDFKENPRMLKAIKPRPPKNHDFSKRDNWFEDFERQNHTLTREILRNMQDFENDFFNDEYYGTEE